MQTVVYMYNPCLGTCTCWSHVSCFGFVHPLDSITSLLWEWSRDLYPLMWVESTSWIIECSLTPPLPRLLVFPRLSPQKNPGHKVMIKYPWLPPYSIHRNYTWNVSSASKRFNKLSSMVIHPFVIVQLQISKPWNWVSKGNFFYPSLYLEKSSCDFLGHIYAFSIERGHFPG